MTQDPIVEEARRAGQDLFARFNNDMAAVTEYLRKQTEEAARAGHKVVSLPPRRPVWRATQPKKAG